MNYIFESFFGLSISLNIALTIAYVAERRKVEIKEHDSLKEKQELNKMNEDLLKQIDYLKNHPIERKETIDAQDLLMDLMAGEALVRVTRISPTDVFLRSPGGR